MALPSRFMIKFILICILAVAVPAGAADGKPQKLPLETVVLGKKAIRVEVARTAEQLATGLMYRKSLAPDSGMLFIFNEQRILSFWMKNTFIPLSIGFFSADKKLIEILDMEPVTSVMQLNIPRYTSSRPAQYALEMNKGWFAKNKVRPGTKIKLPQEP